MQKQKLKPFLQKYHLLLNEQVKQAQHKTPELIKANILSVKDVQRAAQLLNLGELVAFPTETVYGLGANALNQKALLRIYETKKRPLTDPIIVHVLNQQQARKYVEITQNQQKIFKLLTKQFWPGPLTVILKANLNVLPMVVTAQTGFVGLRAPKHQFARKLIQASNLPIGAPSANLFSHVSPTEPVHVFNDFWKDQISIVDGQRCQFGIQSTVLKIFQDKVQIYRQGSLSTNKIRQFLQKQLKQNCPDVRIVKKVSTHNQNMESPGQLLKHYSPNLPSFYAQSISDLQNYKQNLKDLILISFNAEYDKLKQEVGAYYRVQDFSNKIQNQKFSQEEIQQQKFCTKQQKVKMRQIYYLLRLAENLPLKKIVVCWSAAKQGTVWDKIFRATQGKRISYFKE